MQFIYAFRVEVLTAALYLLEGNLESSDSMALYKYIGTFETNYK